MKNKELEFKISTKIRPGDNRVKRTSVERIGGLTINLYAVEKNNPHLVFLFNNPNLSQESASTTVEEQQPSGRLLTRSYDAFKFVFLAFFLKLLGYRLRDLLVRIPKVLPALDYLIQQLGNEGLIYPKVEIELNTVIEEEISSLISSGSSKVMFNGKMEEKFMFHAIDGVTIDLGNNRFFFTLNDECFGINGRLTESVRSRIVQALEGIPGLQIFHEVISPQYAEGADDNMGLKK